MPQRLSALATARLSLALALVASLILSASLTGVTRAEALGTTITFVSDSTWQVFSDSPTSFLGSAQHVCLQGECLPDGVSYGFPGAGWPIDLSSIPGAVWIWAPGVSGQTYPSDLKAFYFAKVFKLTGQPTAGSISISADDSAQVYVNGQLAGKVGSIEDIALASATQSSLTTFDLTPFLKEGVNVIVVRGQNGPAWFAQVCPSGCTYAQNPAGVVFGGSLTSR